MMNKLKIGVLTISDRASNGVYEDISGKEIRSFLGEIIKSEWEEEYVLVPDNSDTIKKAIITLSDKQECSLVITTGGTGPSARDVTPEATRAACSRMLPGFGELMRMGNVHKVPTSILSRQEAGIRGKTLVVNLPGNPKAIRECLELIFPAIPDCLKIIGAPEVQTNNDDIKVLH
jgi:molybdopterin adenylyltransferase